MNNGKLTFKSDDIISFALLSSNTPNQPDDSSKDNSINNSVVNTGDYNYSFAYTLIISAIAVIVLSVLRRKNLKKTKKKTVIIAIISVVIILALGVSAFFIIKSINNKEEQADSNGVVGKISADWDTGLDKSKIYRKLLKWYTNSRIWYS